MVVVTGQLRLRGRRVGGGQQPDACAICSARTRGKLLNGYTVGFGAVGFEWGTHV